MSTTIREQAKQKHELAGEILRLAGPERDFGRTEVLERLGVKTSEEAVQRWHALNEEAHQLFLKAAELERKEQEQSAELEAALTRHAERERALKTPAAVKHPAERASAPSLGRAVVESAAYREWVRTKSAPMVEFTVPLELKTLVSTTAGYAPDSPRLPDVVGAATRPVQVLDLIPTVPISVQLAKWMEKTTYTIAAAEIAEAGTFPESTYVWTERSAAVRKIADSIPVTDEQLEDVDQMQALLDQDLRFGLMQKLDSQVLNGTGVAPQILGILNVSGLQTQARGTDPHFDAMFKAVTKVRAVGRAEPDAIAIHSTDWQTMRLLRTADGIYIMGNPAEPGPMSLFGLPVRISEALTAGTALVGAFGQYTRLYERRGVEVEVGYTGTQFTEGKKTIRASTRVALAVRRAAAFCTVTGL